jgi:hypothetical protein
MMSRWGEGRGFRRKILLYEFRRRGGIDKMMIWLDFNASDFSFALCDWLIAEKLGRQGRSFVL